MLTLACVGLLALYGGDILDNIRGGPGRVDDAHSLALSPQFVNRLNARKDRSWTATIPAGWENARHSDLKRMAGGRLSDRPRGALWTTSAYATPDGTQAAAAAAESVSSTKPRKASTLGQEFARLIGGPGDRGRIGGFIDDFIGGPAPVHTGDTFDPIKWGLPEHFDARQKWPKCASLVGGGRDQGNCGSCWAMAPAEVMSDRLCIQSNGARAIELSPFGMGTQRVVACCFCR